MNNENQEKGNFNSSKNFIYSETMPKYVYILGIYSGNFPLLHCSIKRFGNNHIRFLLCVRITCYYLDEGHTSMSV